ncbi:MAG: CBS domain-containing protein [archaeon]
MKKQLSYFLIIFLVIQISLAELPSLPTYVYGRISTGGDVTASVSGISVTASWIDSSGISKTMSQKTNNAGYYFFNNGFIDAKEGSEIIITAASKFVKLMAAPGKGAVYAPDIFLLASEITQENNMNFASKRSTASSNADVKTNQKYNENDWVENSSEKSDYKKALLYDGQVSAEALIRFTPGKISGEITELNKIASSIESITIFWTDEKEKMHSNKVEIKKPETLSNKTCYQFELNYSGTATKALLQFESIKSTVNIDNRQDVLIKYDLITDYAKYDKIKSDYARQQIFEQIAIIARSFLYVVLAIGLLFLLIKIIVFIYKVVIKALVAVATNITIDPLKASARKIMKKQCYLIKSAESTISSGTEFVDALNLLARNKTDTYLVVDYSSYRGVVSEHDFLKIGYGFDKELYDLNISHFMRKKTLVISQEATIMDAFSVFLEEKCTRLALKYKENLTGQITLHDIQKEFKGFSRFFAQKSESGLYTVRDLLTKDVYYLEKSDSVEAARKLMLKQDIKMIIATEGNKPVGVFTIKDYVRNLANFCKNFTNHAIENEMSSPITTIDPDINIFEANEFMLSHELNNFPVIVNDEVIGILTQEKLCEEMYRYLSELE